MISWVNVAVLILSTLLFFYFYVKSVGPASLEQKIGPCAYATCTRFRLIATAFMTLTTISYVLYFFFPLSIGLPEAFPWPWWLSALIAVAIAIPAGYVWIRGMIDAGQETMTTKKEHEMYGGIYEKIRHPQAVGECPFWFVIAFFLHSPFLVLYSLVWIPIFYLMCLAEERDLVIRYGQAYEEYRVRTGMLFPRRS